MADLFQTTQQNVSLHLQNIYEEGELHPEATHKEFLSVRREGKLDVQRTLDFYNLDAIISVVYRINSRVATQFRIWAANNTVQPVGSKIFVRTLSGRYDGITFKSGAA